MAKVRLGGKAKRVYVVKGCCECPNREVADGHVCSEEDYRQITDEDVTKWDLVGMPEWCPLNKI